MGTLPSSTYTFFCASDTIVLAVQMLDTLMMTHPTRKAVQIMPTSRILFSRCLIIISVYCLILFNFITYSLCSIGMIAPYDSFWSFSNSLVVISV